MEENRANRLGVGAWVTIGIGLFFFIGGLIASKL